MKKVLILTYYWPPSAGAGVQRWVKFARYLSGDDWQLHVVTVDPAKASYVVVDQELGADVPDAVKVTTTKTREPFNVYRKLTGAKQIPFAGFANEDNPSFTKKMSRWVRGNFFIPDARVGWNKFAYKAAKQIIEAENIDVIVTTSPPHSTQLVGLRLKREFGLPWLADLRDPWTEIYYYKKMLQMKGALRKDAAYERSVLEEADRVTVVSQHIRKEFMGKANVPDDRIVVIPNGYDELDFQQPHQPEKEAFTISYTGTIAESYPVDALVTALVRIRQADPEVPVAIRFIGTVSESIKTKLADAGLADLATYVGYVDHTEAVRYMCTSSVLLLVIPDVEGNEGILTGKMFEYLGSGRPILGLGPVQGDASAIIDACEAGKMYAFTDAEGVEKQLTDWIGQWKNDPNLRITSEKRLHYTRQNLAVEMGKLLKALTEK